MEKLHTNKVNEVKSFEILKTITINELEKRKFKGLPACLKISNKKYAIGRCKLTKLDVECEVIDGFDTITFSSFANAMFYCIYVQTHNEKDAKALALLDTQFRHLMSDSITFKAKLADAEKSKDGWKYDLYAARFTQAQAQLDSVTEELEKNLILAKYYKLKDFKL